MADTLTPIAVSHAVGDIGDRAPLRVEIEQLRAHLEEAEQTLAAIRSGDVDAIVVSGPEGEQIFSLSSAETVYRRVFETMAEAALSVTPEGLLLFCNARFAELVETPLEKVLGQDLVAWIPAEGRDGFRALLRQCEQQPVKRKVVLRAAGGALKPMHVTGYALQQPGGSTLCLIATDLTELEASTQCIAQLQEQQRALEARQAELEESRLNAIILMEQAEAARRLAERTAAALRESEERLRLAQNAASVGIWDWNLESGELRWTPELEHLYGYAENAFPRTYEAFRERVHPDDLETIERLRDEAVRAHQPFDFDFRIQPGSGETRWLNCKGSAVYDEAGEPLRVLGVNIDISKRKEAEEALRDSEKRLDLALESGRMGMWQWNISAGCSVWNAMEYELLGLPTGAGLESGEKFFEYVHPDDAPALRQSLNEAVRQGHQWRDEFRIIRPDGEVRWLVGEGRLIRDPEDPYRMMFGVNYDITESKQVEEVLREADRSKDQFLAMLAHELRNPLAPIRTGLQVLRVSGGQTPDTERVHAMMERQINHLVRLVDDLLEVSRVTQGKIELKTDRVDLSAVVGNAIEISMPLIQAGNHVLEVTEHAGGPLLVQGDPVRLAQVMANLLNNAAKYMERGGRIRVLLERRGAEAVVSVQDEGIGVSAEMLSRVFDLFTQVDRSIDRARGGLGIGLALVRRLVELHGGRVEARSKGVGRGSEFLVYLPLAAGVGAGASKVSAPKSANRSLRRILVVDDNKDAADSLGLLLDGPQTEVRVAYDGHAALEAMNAFHPEIILLDLGMPGMDGLETARHIRQYPEGQDVTLIALTGWGQDEDQRLTREAGFDHHLVKPVDLGALQALLASAQS